MTFYGHAAFRELADGLFEDLEHREVFALQLGDAAVEIQSDHSDDDDVTLPEYRSLLGVKQGFHASKTFPMAGLHLE